MPFDIGLPYRSAPHCGTCPVQSCPARCAHTASTWQSLVGLMPSQMPGASTLLTAGEPVPALFAVRAGCIKSYTIDAQGNEHVRGFHFPGDLVGLDALGVQRSPSSAAAVTPSQVCAVPVAEIRKRLGTDPGLSGHLLEKTRHELSLALARSGEYTADQRVAAFLLYVHSRIGLGEVVRLPMTRREMGSYLRLATETVCRVLARFEQKGWLQSQDKRITLKNIDALRELADPVGLDEPAALALAA